MSVKLHDDKRIRIYVSLGTINGKKKCVQEYIPLVGLTANERIKAWEAAYKREKEIKKEHEALSREEKKQTPFRFESKNQEGITPDTPFIIRGLTVSVPSPAGTRQLYPDWQKKGYLYQFHTYPPRITVQLYDHSDGVRNYYHTKAFTLRTSTDYTEQFEKAVDYIIKNKPALRKHRKEMLDSMPPWKVVREFIERKYYEHWQELPWLVKYDIKKTRGE